MSPKADDPLGDTLRVYDGIGRVVVRERGRSVFLFNVGQLAAFERCLYAKGKSNDSDEYMAGRGRSKDLLSG